MPTVRFDGVSVSLEENESVLDALLRAGHSVSHSCKAGSCGSCLLKAVEGRVPERAQQGLKDSWKAQGYFLACVCHPDEDLSVSEATGARIGARIAALAPLSRDVLEVRLQADAPLEFRAGQYITLIRPDGLARSYSIASLPEDDVIVLHVRLLAGGKMSGWLSGEARPGDRVDLLGPSGECFYVPGRPEQPLVMVGTGTGLAPLYGIVRDALRQGHTGPIHLFHGAVQPAGLYLRKELADLAERHAQLTYAPVVLADADEPGMEVGSIDQVLVGRFPKLAGFRGFVCGDPALVGTLRKKMFLAGMNSREIYADAFLPSAEA